MDLGESEDVSRPEDPKGRRTISSCILRHFSYEKTSGIPLTSLIGTPKQTSEEGEFPIEISGSIE